MDSVSAEGKVVSWDIIKDVWNIRNECWRRCTL